MKTSNLNTLTHSLSLILISLFSTSISVAKDTVSQDSSLDINQWQMAGYTESNTPISEHPAYRPLKRVLVSSVGEQELAKMAAALPEIEFVSVNNFDENNSSFDAVLSSCRQGELLSKVSNVVWMQIYSAGVDACMKDAQFQKLLSRDNGLIVTNSSGAAASIIAEHSIAMMMSLARGLHRFRDAQAKSNWARSLASELGATNTIGGKTMLVLGLGSIGNEVAKRANALGMRVLATRHSSRSGPDYVEYVGLTNETLKLAEQADVVVNALPLTDSTKGFIDKRFFDILKPTAQYISVGRGGTTDTDALLQALENNSIASAALDVTDPEPLPENHPLWQQANVIITPHISGSGGDGRTKTFLLALENLRRYQAGEPMLNIVDTNLGY